MAGVKKCAVRIAIAKKPIAKLITILYVIKFIIAFIVFTAAIFNLIHNISYDGRNIFHFP